MTNPGQKGTFLGDQQTCPFCAEEEAAAEACAAGKIVLPQPHKWENLHGLYLLRAGKGNLRSLL
jgi:hypothetical protein